MEYNKWVGSHDWNRADDIIDGYPSFNERCRTDTQDLDNLIRWLEYAGTGYPAARQTICQEEYWAGLLRNLLCKELIKELMFFSNNTFRIRCALCNDELKGTIINDGGNIRADSIMCVHIEKRYLDIFQYVLNEFKVWHV